jgi:hypothetical protein
VTGPLPVGEACEAAFADWYQATPQPAAGTGPVDAAVHGAWQAGWAAGLAWQAGQPVWGVFDESYSPGPAPLISVHAAEEEARAELALPEYQGMVLCVEKLAVGR